MIANTISSLCGTTTTLCFTIAVCDYFVFTTIVTLSFNSQVLAVD
jgi:hypothetical protein